MPLRRSQLTSRLPVLAAGLALALTAGTGPHAAAATRTVPQPTPPVTAQDFPMEPTGTAPSDGDGLIPNPQTPTGSPVAPPSSCTVTFNGATSTSADVNSWISSNENSLTGLTVLCLTGTFTSPLHVW